jgi:hypothetical protein
MLHKLEKLQLMSGFQLGKIPKGVTLLEYYSNIPIESVICDGVEYIYFLYTPTIISWLPKSVKKITVPSYKALMYENLQGVKIEIGIKFNHLDPNSALIRNNNIAIGMSTSGNTRV